VGHKVGQKSYKEVTVGAQVARLVGGAGTGKTSELLDIMRGVVPHLAGGPSQIGFASFTRAAREEVVSRAALAFDVPEGVLSHSGWFRTVHSTCYRILKIKNDELLKSDDKSIRWIADQLRVSVGRKMVDDSGYSSYYGDEEAAAALNLWDISRNRVVPLRTVHEEKSRAGIDVPGFGVIRHFAEKYENAKRLNGRCDFVDILGRYAGIRFGLDGPEGVEPEGELPADVAVWIFDEYQDSSKLVDRVCRRLVSGPNVRWAYLAADPFQSVFGFGGADFRNFLAWDVDKERTMPQSWRCPKPIMELGERCLRRMKTGYFDRGIAPAGHAGRIIREPSIERALQNVDSSRSTLILARCNYSLAKYSTILEQRNIPHARINEDDSTRPLMAFNAYWKLQHGKGVSAEAMKIAVDLTPASGGATKAHLVRGAKAKWSQGKMDGIEFVHPDDLPAVGFTPLMIEKIKDGTWASLLPRGAKWYAAAKKFGPEQATKPNVRLSTIHGAKGMEAQDVVLATETAYRVEEERGLDPSVHDEECRIEYVGVTRAKERLIICESDEAYSMNLPY